MHSLQTIANTKCTAYKPKKISSAQVNFKKRAKLQWRHVHLHDFPKIVKCNCIACKHKKMSPAQVNSTKMWHVRSLSTKTVPCAQLKHEKLEKAAKIYISAQLRYIYVHSLLAHAQLKKIVLSKCAALYFLSAQLCIIHMPSFGRGAHGVG